MSPGRREILEKVARGELTPEEADALLRGAEEGAAPDRPAPEPTSPVAKIKVSAGFGAIVVIGDASVAEAEVEGPHTATVEGDTFLIRGDLDPVQPGGFSIHLGARRMRHMRVGGRSASSLRVRMNPALALEARLDAGPLSISDVKGPIRARCAAGPITIEDFSGPLDVAVNAGAVRAIGILTDGESRIRSDAGAVRVELESGSSVHIVADAALGKVVLPGSEEPERRKFGSRREATVGNGDATLRVETAMGSIHVSTA
ncbi:MAG TPA: hypothetical protein VFA34_16755 [Actinomycetota bacterium]|nr:hypothetical protein [Actinomycetota bacterium]